MCSTPTQVAQIFVTHSLHPALVAYKIHVGDYPSTEEGLAALIKSPPGKEELWKGPYIEWLPSDPWDNPYQYRYPGIHENVDYELFSLGVDGMVSSDDISNWAPRVYGLQDTSMVMPVIFMASIITLISLGAILLKRAFMKRLNTPRESSQCH